MIYKFLKNIFFVSSFLFYLTTYSLSEINSKAWSYECSADKSRCITIIKKTIKNTDNKDQTLATAYFEMESSKQNKIVPVLYVKLPLSVDLRKKPAIIIDDKNLGSLDFTHCNAVDGCTTNVAIGDGVIDLFKKGKTITVVMGIYGSAKNINIQFPLKNFSKSYAQLIKK